MYSNNDDNLCKVVCKENVTGMTRLASTHDTGYAPRSFAVSGPCV